MTKAEALLDVLRCLGYDPTKVIADLGLDGLRVRVKGEMGFTWYSAHEIRRVRAAKETTNG